MLLAMLIRWEVIGRPHYPSMDAGQNIAYISDIGAEGLKPLFIAGCCVTTVFLDLAFASERWLRHTGRLVRNTSTAEKVLSALAIFFAIAGTAGLILLSIFDTLRHPHLHDGFLLLFIAGYVISAIFLCAEYQRLGIHYRQHRVLRMSFWVKLTFIIVEVGLAVGFIVCTYTGHYNPGAVFEWVIALVFTLWVLSFLMDLLPAVRTKHRKDEAGAPQLEMGHGAGNAHVVGGGRGDSYDGATLTNGQTGPGYNREAYGAPNSKYAASPTANF